MSNESDSIRLSAEYERAVRDREFQWRDFQRVLEAFRGWLLWRDAQGEGDD